MHLPARHFQFEHVEFQTYTANYCAEKCVFPRSLGRTVFRFFTVENSVAITAPFVAEARQNSGLITCYETLESLLKAKLREKQVAHYHDLIQNTASQPWVYYGAGDCYTKNREFFAVLKPQAILVDKAGLPSVTHLDGIPVAAAEDFFAKEEARHNNVMVFLGHSLAVKRKLLRHYGVAFANIHSCSQVL